MMRLEWKAVIFWPMFWRFFPHTIFRRENQLLRKAGTSKKAVALSGTRDQAWRWPWRLLPLSALLFRSLCTNLLILSTHEKYPNELQAAICGELRGSPSSEHLRLITALLFVVHDLHWLEEQLRHNTRRNLNSGVKPIN